MPVAPDQPATGKTAPAPSPAAAPPAAPHAGQEPPAPPAAALPGSALPPRLADLAAPHEAARHTAREAEPVLRQLVTPITTLAAGGTGEAPSAPRTVSVALNPAELGRVELTVEKRGDGRLSIGVAVERAETLALLRTDQGALDRALTEAGLPPEGRSISFDLSGSNGWSGAEREAGAAPRGNRDGRGQDAPMPATTEPSETAGGPAPTRTVHAAGRLDISI
ncbi:MAG: flagellar hook-length control protein FliK [Acetobacteraceae bacterium]|nr:flagellar hook-length control protein FliK [Acetobacteraceae bacterium]